MKDTWRLSRGREEAVEVSLIDGDETLELRTYRYGATETMHSRTITRHEASSMLVWLVQWLAP